MANRTVSVNLVANIGQYVGGMNTAAAATMRLGQSATANGRTARSAFDIAGKGGVLMGAAIAGGMALAVNKSMEFEKSMSAVAAATQATTSTLGNLRAAAMKAGADTAYSATEAADAITEMAKAGVSAEDIMGGGLTGALSLAAAGQLDVAEAAGIASTAMTQFSLSGKDLPHVADLLAAGAGKAMGSVDDLGMALNQAGLIASASGLSIEETTGTLAAFAAAGLLGSDAGTSMKTMLQKLQAPSKEAAGVMSDLGINMYDAKGNMLGMSEMAGQLKDHMSGLTQEQRNNALATIFGSDAVRAANVLYKEGAAGISGWTSKVNDAGYAAKTAAQLQDNLSGDLEKLGGAFDTLMIGIGSGAQGPLRSLVQAFAGVLDGITALGGPLKALGGFIADHEAIVIGLATALGVQLAGGFTAATVAANRFILTPVVLGLSGVLSGLTAASTFMAGGFTAAVATARTALMGFLTAAAPLAAVAAITYGVVKTLEIAHAAGNAREEIRGMWDAVNDSRGGAQVEALGSTVDQLDSKVSRLRENLSDDGAWETTILGAWLTGAAADKEALEQYEIALRDAQAQQDQLTHNTAVMGVQFGLNRDQVLDLASKYNIDLTGSVSNVHRQFENFYSAEFGVKPTEAAIGTRVAMDDAKTAIDDAKTAIDNFKLSLDILTGAHVSMIQVESAFQSAIAEANGAMDDMNGSVLDGSGNLNLQSEAGRKAADVLLGVRDSGNQLISTMLQQGATSVDVQAKDAQLRKSFIDTAGQMGITGQNAETLADQILGIPGSRNTAITADTSQAVAAVDSLVDKIKNAGGRVIYTGVATHNTTGISARAAGGIINGPGTGTSDSILGRDAYSGAPTAWVSAGEFVVNKKATDENRGLIEAINAGRVSQGGLGYLAAGGPVLGGSYSIPLGLSDATAAGLQKALEAKYAGSLGSGTVGAGAWGAIWQYVKTRIPQARMNSTYRPGDPGYHGRGKAIDFGFGSGPGGAGSAGLASINRLLYDNVGRNLAELIYDGIGDDRADIKNGANHTYNAGTRAEHRNHVHAAVYHQGTDYVPQTGWAYLEKGEAVIPAAANPASREFSGGPGGGTVVKVAAPDLSGLRIAGTLDLGGGLEARIDGRIVTALTGVHDRGAY